MMIGIVILYGWPGAIWVRKSAAYIIELPNDKAEKEIRFSTRWHESFHSYPVWTVFFSF
jgi:hypothetical protein